MNLTHCRTTVWRAPMRAGAGSVATSILSSPNLWYRSRSIDLDDHLATRVAFLDIGQRLRHLRQWIGAVDDRLHAARRHEFGEMIEIAGVESGDEELERVVGEATPGEDLDRHAERAHPRVAPAATN